MIVAMTLETILRYDRDQKGGRLTANRLSGEVQFQVA